MWVPTTQIPLSKPAGGNQGMKKTSHISQARAAVRDNEEIGREGFGNVDL